MLKRAIAAVLAVVLSLQSIACYSNRRHDVEPSALAGGTSERIIGVTKADGDVVPFDDSGPVPRLAHDTIYATVKGAPYEIAMADVSRVWVERQEADPAKTVGAVIGVTAGLMVVALLIVAATKESCPFVYSWDGTRYWFDAEPYGGAITRGLERDDYGELEHLVPADGHYQLLVRNEVNEAQYSNLLELMVVDHPPGVRVAADEGGGIHTLRAPQSPLWARDAQGHDLRRWLDATDNRIWEPPAVPSPDSSYRQTIEMAFLKPEGARSVKLIANAATGLWGSHMIRAMLELRGNRVHAWYASVDGRPAARDSVLAWNLREELYALKIYVEEPTGWNVRGILQGGGPFIAEDRVVPLDLSRVVGPELHIRIQPPVGFWAINSFAVDYSADETVHITQLLPTSARDQRGQSVLSDVRAADDRYYEMPRTGDWAKVTFPAPAPIPGASRTMFLRSRGYYRLNLPPGGEPDTAAVRKIMEVPGAPARMAAAAYAAYMTARRR